MKLFLANALFYLRILKKALLELLFSHPVQSGGAWSAAHCQLHRYILSVGKPLPTSGTKQTKARPALAQVLSVGRSTTRKREALLISSCNRGFPLKDTHHLLTPTYRPTFPVNLLLSYCVPFGCLRTCPSPVPHPGHAPLSTRSEIVVAPFRSYSILPATLPLYSPPSALLAESSPTIRHGEALPLTNSEPAAL